jgi:hypothetical protein
MRTVYGNLWTAPAAWRLIPTNTCVKRGGEAVMGAGAALDAARRYPGLAAELGAFLRRRPAQILVAHFPQHTLSCVPTKRDWRQPSDLGLIERGLRQLLADLRSLPNASAGPIALPLLGCGLGQLRSSDVLPLLERLLDDRFVLVLQGRRCVLPACRRPSSSHSSYTRGVPFTRR